MTITQETAIKYVKDKSDKCPECGSIDIIGERHEVAGDYIIQEITCEKCGLVYYDIYQLVGLGIIEPEAITEYYADGRVEHG